MEENEQKPADRGWLHSLGRRVVAGKRVCGMVNWQLGVEWEYRWNDGHGEHYGYPRNTAMLIIKIGHAGYGFGVRYTPDQMPTVEVSQPAKSQ